MGAASRLLLRKCELAGISMNAAFDLDTVAFLLTKPLPKAHRPWAAKPLHPDF